MEGLIVSLMIAVLAFAGVRAFGSSVFQKSDCQASTVASLGEGSATCGAAEGRAALVDGNELPPADDQRLLTRAAPPQPAEPMQAAAEPPQECAACKAALGCPTGEPKADGPKAPAAKADAPRPPAPKAEEPRDPIDDKLAEIQRLDDENAALRGQRKNARSGSAEDRIDDAIKRNDKRIAEIGKELFGPRADWRRANGPAQKPGALAALLGMDAGGRAPVFGRLSPADIKDLEARATALAKKTDDERAELEATIAKVSSPEIEQLKAQAEAHKAQAKAHDAEYARRPGLFEWDRRNEHYAAARAEWKKVVELQQRIRELQLAGTPAEVRARQQQVAELQARLRALREEIVTAHLPPTLHLGAQPYQGPSSAGNDEALRALKGEDLERAWVAWALQQRELDRIAAFEAALAGHPDRAQIQAEIDAAIVEARKDARGPLPDAARAEFDRYFVPRAVVGGDGKVTVSFVPTDELRRLQMQQAAYVGYKRIEFGGGRVQPFSAPHDSREALAWWLAFGSTQPRRLGHIVEPNHSIRATHDEMILIPGGTLMRGVGTVGARQLVKSAVCEIAVNAGMAVAVEEISKKFGPTAGATTPIAVILTAILTRRVVGGPRAAAAGPALNAEAKAAMYAEAKVAANAARAADVAKGFKTQPLLPKYVGENLPGNRVHGGGWLVKYLDDAERETHRLTVRDGKLYDAKGKLFDTKAAATAHSGDGRAIFVMDEQGRIYVSTYQEVGKFHHSSMLAGKPVTGAGELVVENGVVKLISNKSGHYQPTAAMNEQVIKSLETQGVKTRDIVRDNPW
ncbi:MAG: hypothetical protein WKG00_33970 [Polyangiaceae bacterium]